MPTARQIKKLKAIGYSVSFDRNLDDGYGGPNRPTARATRYNIGKWFEYRAEADEPCWGKLPKGLQADLENEAWAACWEHQRSPEGMVATMAAKVRWFKGCRIMPVQSNGNWSTCIGKGDDCKWGDGDSPEAATTALWEAVT